MRGQVALVTGGGGGIGRAVAIKLAGAGARVLVADWAEEAARTVADEVSGFGEADWLFVDVGDRDSVEQMISHAFSRFGQLDIVVHCAGICETVSLLDISDEQWDRLMRVNLKGTFLVGQAALREMLRRRQGRIINIASIAGEVGGFYAGAHYAASKAGVICLTKSLAKAGAPHVKVNAVSPGPVDTGMTGGWPGEVKKKLVEGIPAGRFATAEDVAEAVLFLAGPSGDYMTGQVLRLNGGALML